ncbi:SdpI family protein [Actinomycetospora sp. TBRC 11914]|uniref:SdpI family protein n=1 Tax=Actinomycetospora sp. TBRC 11914 TaxID=2729387 RepID=UPI00145DCDCA|nr:SdpI family protein [Actinomycetospora sp. TBRC 11914]NMO93473.1 SdpI family protein [Actinomycetospora sp. TBRC 11914]
MVVPVLAVVLVVAAAAVLVVGILAAAHRLPRNRVIGVRTVWTMSRVDSFRRANQVAAPAFAAAGVVGLAAGLVALLAPTTAAAVTLVVVGFVGLVVLTGVAGAVGSRFAAVDREQTLAAEGLAAGPCTLDEGTGDAGAEAADCGSGAGTCGGACALCPRAGAQQG